MISYIRGELAAVLERRVIVDAGGIGYSISMPERLVGLLPPAGNTVKIYTYLHVKEDGMQLFGFLTEDDLEVFKLVIGVSGIGPKGGLNILSQLSADDLRFAVFSNDVKAISAAQGIGRKSAEKLILELKDKLRIEDALEGREAEASDITVFSDGTLQNDAVAALTALGYSGQEALKAVKKVEISRGMEAEDVLKEALRNLIF